MSPFFQFPPQGLYGSCDAVELREIGIGKDPDIQFCHLLFVSFLCDFNIKDIL